MGREVVVLWAGRHRRDPWQALVDEFYGKIRRHLRLVERQVRGHKRGDDAERRRRDGEALLAALPEKCWVVALDGRGKQLDSMELARRLDRLQEDWPHEIVFIIGSDVGLDDAVLDRADEVLSLGPLTLRHELARLVLAEQLYRAMTIRAGTNYHR